MTILRQVPRSEVTSEVVDRYYTRLFGDRDPVTQPGTATGTPGDWWTVFALSSPIFQHAVDGFALYLGGSLKVDPILREFGQTRAGWAKGSQFVFSQHCKSLRGLGVSEEKIAAIAHWTVADCYSEQERAVLAYTDCLTQADGRVPLEVFDTLKSFLDDEQIVELTYVIGMYSMHAVMSRALRLEYDARQDPVFEIAAPKSFGAANFLGTEPATATDLPDGSPRD
jgi:alkylhydroperoxidase family enzyme